MQLQQEKIKTNATLSQLQKLQDSKSFDQNKRSVGGAASTSTSSTTSGKESSQGFQFFHLMLIALISLLVGAFISRSANDEPQLGNLDL